MAVVKLPTADTWVRDAITERITLPRSATMRMEVPSIRTRARWAGAPENYGTLTAGRVASVGGVSDVIIPLSKGR